MMVSLYTKLPEADDPAPCPYCARAKEWLRGHNIKFTEYALTREQRKEFYREKRLPDDQQTVPQVYVEDPDTGDSYRIGGYDRLRFSALESLFNPPPMGPAEAIAPLPPQYEVVTTKLGPAANRRNHHQFGGTEVAPSVNPAGVKFYTK